MTSKIDLMTSTLTTDEVSHAINYEIGQKCFGTTKIDIMDFQSSGYAPSDFGTSVISNFCAFPLEVI